MDLNFFLCQRRGLSQMVLSLSQVQCYLAMVPNPDKLRVATDPQTLVVDIMAMWYDSHLLCEFLIFATLVFHNFPPLVFGFGDYAFCICTCWWQMWLLCRQNPLLCHVPKIASDTETALIKPPATLMGSTLCYFEGPGTSTPLTLGPQCTTEILGKQLFHPYLCYI